MGSSNTSYTSYTEPIDRWLNDGLVWAIAFALLILHASLAWSGREIGVLTSQDDIRYLLLSRSLKSLTYRDLWLVGQPPHNIYPPLYPAFLAVWGAFSGGSFARLLVPSVMLSTAALGVAFMAIRRIWSPTGALLCLACLAVNPSLINRAGSVRSEGLFMLLVLLALWGLATRAPSRRLLWMVGLAAILAALTRTAGVSLLAAIAVLWLLERRHKAVLVLVAASGLTIGAWLIWSVLAPAQFEGLNYFALATAEGDAGFLASMVDRVGRLVPNYGGLGTPWVLALPTIGGTPLDNIFWAFVVGSGVFVGLVEMYRRWRVVVGFLLLYAVVILSWPFALSRLLEPAIPLLIPTLLLGLALMVRRYGRSWSLGVILAMSLILVSGGLARSIDHVRQRQSCGPFSLEDPPTCIQRDRASYLRALHHIGETIEQDALFLTAKPEVLFYYPGQKSILLESLFSTEPEQFHSELVDRGVDYVLLGSVHVHEVEILADLLQAHCESFSVEGFFEPRTYLFRVREPGELARGAGACQAMEHYVRANANRDFIQE
jgi:hypothetical protein